MRRRLLQIIALVAGVPATGFAQSQDLFQHLAAPVLSHDAFAGIDTVDVVVTGNTRLAWIETEFAKPQVDSTSGATYKRTLMRVAFDCRLETMDVVSVTLATGDTVRSSADIPAGTAPPHSVEPGTTNATWLHKICGMPRFAFGAGVSSAPHRTFTVPTQPLWLPVFYNLPDGHAYVDGAHIERAGALRTVWIKMVLTRQPPGELFANQTFDCARRRVRLNWTRFDMTGAPLGDEPGIEATPAKWDPVKPGSLAAAQSRLACASTPQASGSAMR